jgi:hypothetical protein
MLIILNDPTGVTGIKRLPFDLSISLQSNIERHLSGGSDAELRINGQKVDPLTDPRLDMRPARDDLVTVALRPAGFEVVIAFLAENWIAITAATLSLYSLTNRPNFGGLDASGSESPNNRLTGQSNVARTYQAIPDVYGYRRIWPDLIQASTSEYVDQIKYVTEWLCMSRGHGVISDVRYAETPIADIDGSSFEVFEPVAVDGYPEFGNVTLSDVYETFASDEVNGQEVPYAFGTTAITKPGTFAANETETTFTATIADSADIAVLKAIADAGGTAGVEFDYGSGATFDSTVTVVSYAVAGANVTFTFSGAPAWAQDYSELTSFIFRPSAAIYQTIGPFTLPRDADRIWWNTVFLRGLQGTVTIRAEWWKIDGNGAEVSGTRQQQDYTYTASTYDQRFFTEKVTPTGGLGRYRIQFQRRTPQADSSGADVAKLEEVYAVRYYPTKTLPGVTVMRVTTKATLSATGFSDRKFNLRWFRKVRTLTADTLSTSRNFGRALAHVWTLARNDIAGLDVDSIQALATEHGDDADILRFDGSLDDANMSLGERMQMIADHARCIVWRDGSRWSVRRNQRQDYPVLQLDYRNLAARGESSITYSAHLPASYDGVEIEYVDEASQSKKAYVRLVIASGSPVVGVGSNMRKIKLVGCATTSQAENRGQFEARRLLYQRTTVNDTALWDVWAHGPGALVRWVDPADFGGDVQAGEVISRSGAVIRTSEPLAFGAYSSGRMVLTGEYGQRLGPPIVCTPNPDGSVTLAEIPSGIYVADADRQCGSRYAFAAGLTADELDSAGLFLIADVRPGSDGTASVALTAYDDRIYEAD